MPRGRILGRRRRGWLGPSVGGADTWRKLQRSVTWIRQRGRLIYRQQREKVAHMSLTPSARDGKKYESSLSESNLLDSPTGAAAVAAAAFAVLAESSGPKESLSNALIGEEVTESVDNLEGEGEGELVRMEGDW